MSFVGTIDDAKDPTMILYAVHEISHAARSGQPRLLAGRQPRPGLCAPGALRAHAHECRIVATSPRTGLVWLKTVR